MMGKFFHIRGFYENQIGYVDLENGDSAQPGFVDREADARMGISPLI
jgi:hypothetical protein